MKKKYKLHKGFLPLLCALLLLPPAARAQRVVTLAECLEKGAEYDPGVRTARLDLESARAQRAEARWEYVPRISLVSGGYYSLKPLLQIAPEDILGGYWKNVLAQMVTDAALQAGVQPWFESFKYGWGAFASAVQPVYAGGRIANGNRLASLGVQAGELQFAVKQRETAAGIEEKYSLGVSLQEKMQTLGQTRQLLDSLERDARAAVDAGLISDSDLLQVRLKQRELSSGLARLRSALKLAKMDLFNAVGLEYTYLDIDSYTLEGSSFADLSAPSAYLIPEIEEPVTDESRLLSLQVEAERLQKRLAVGEYLPQLSVGVSYGYSDLRGRGQGRLNGLGFAMLQIPITDIGKAAARARRYDSRIEKARVQKEYLDAQLALLGHKLRLDMESAWEQLELASEAVRTAQDAARKARARYDAGQVTMSDLLQTELAVRTAEEERIDRKMDYNLAVNAYLRRCGKL